MKSLTIVIGTISVMFLAACGDSDASKKTETGNDQTVKTPPEDNDEKNATTQKQPEPKLVWPTPETEAKPGPGIQANGIGPLKDIVSIGDADGWRGAMDAGVYWLENKSDPDAIRYYFSPYDEKTNGVRKIELHVTFDSADAKSRAGLLYGYQDQPRFYYLIVAGPAGELEVYRRDQSGLSMRMGSATDQPKSGYMQLTLIETGRQLSIQVDGEEKFGFENNTTGRGAVGIAALGTGRFGFTNYRESLIPADGGAPAGGAPAGNAPPSGGAPAGNAPPSGGVSGGIAPPVNRPSGN